MMQLIRNAFFVSGGQKFIGAFGVDQMFGSLA